MTEDYVNFVGDLMYPKKKFGTFGYNADKLKVFHPFNLNPFHREITTYAVKIVSSCKDNNPWIFTKPNT